MAAGSPFGLDNAGNVSVAFFFFFLLFGREALSFTSGPLVMRSGVLGDFNYLSDSNGRRSGSRNCYLTTERRSERLTVG